MLDERSGALRSNESNIRRPHWCITVVHLPLSSVGRPDPRHRCRSFLGICFVTTTTTNVAIASVCRITLSPIGPDGVPLSRSWGEDERERERERERESLLCGRPCVRPSCAFPPPIEKAARGEVRSPLPKGTASQKSASESLLYMRPCTRTEPEPTVMLVRAWSAVQRTITSFATWLPQSRLLRAPSPLDGDDSDDEPGNGSGHDPAIGSVRGTLDDGTAAAGDGQRRSPRVVRRAGAPGGGHRYHGWYSWEAARHGDTYLYTRPGVSYERHSRGAELALSSSAPESAPVHDHQPGHFTHTVNEEEGDNRPSPNRRRRRHSAGHAPSTTEEATTGRPTNAGDASAPPALLEVTLVDSTPYASLAAAFANNPYANGPYARSARFVGPLGDYVRTVDCPALMRH